MDSTARFKCLGWGQKGPSGFGVIAGGMMDGTVNVWEVPGFRIEMSPFGGIKDSGLGYKEGVIEAMKSFTNVKTFSLPWQ